MKDSSARLPRDKPTICSGHSFIALALALQVFGVANAQTPDRIEVVYETTEGAIPVPTLEALLTDLQVVLTPPAEQLDWVAETDTSSKLAPVFLPGLAMGDVRLAGFRWDYAGSIWEYAETDDPTLLIQLASAAPGVAEAQRVQDDSFVPLTELVLYYHEQASPLALDDFPGAESLENDYPLEGMALLTQSSGFTMSNVMNISEHPEIRRVEPSFPGALAAAPMDCRYRNGDQWGLRFINAEAAWTSVTTSTKRIAVIDTGIDFDHPELRDNFGQPPGVNVRDDVSTSSDSCPASHGTAVAGIIAAKGDNDDEYCMKASTVGVCWEAPLYAVRAFKDRDDKTPTPVLIKALSEALAWKPDIINCSWTTSYDSEGVRGILQRALDDGVLVVVAAGNTKAKDRQNLTYFEAFPACYDYENMVVVMSVGNDGEKGRVSKFSEEHVDLAAPGEAILSTLRNGRFNTGDGTSFAAPFVTGALALLWNHPDYREETWDVVRAALLANVRKVENLGEFCATSGVLDLTFLKQSASQPDPGQQTVEGVLEPTGGDLVGDAEPYSLRTDDERLELDFDESGWLRDDAERALGTRVSVSGSRVNAEDGRNRSILRVKEIEPEP